RRDPDREPLRRHPLRRGVDAPGLDGHASFGILRRTGHTRSLRARPRKRPGYSRTGHGQPLRHHPLRGDDVPPRPGTPGCRRGHRAGRLSRPGGWFQDAGPRRRAEHRRSYTGRRQVDGSRRRSHM
ncbi:MAG: 3-isopropylmalate dehydrogenase, partial [uncultured Rubrobacteraceae bacterium]